MLEEPTRVSMLTWLPRPPEHCVLMRKLNETFAPFVGRALNQIRYHDEPMSFESYGEYAKASTRRARYPNCWQPWPGSVRTRQSCPSPSAALSTGCHVAATDLDRALTVIRGPPTAFHHAGACRKAEISRFERRLPGLSPNRSTHRDAGSRRETAEVRRIPFSGCPSIVVFHTRCDN